MGSISWYTFLFIVYMWLVGAGMLTVIFERANVPITPYYKLVINGWPIMLPIDIAYCRYHGIHRK